MLPRAYARGYEDIMMKTNSLGYKVRQYLLFAGVTTFLFVAVVIVPFFYGLYLTFTRYDGVSTSKPFVGLDNYIAAFGDTDYWVSLGRTFVFSAIAVVLVNLFAFVLAYMVTTGIRGQNFFRAGFFIPNLIGGIVLGYVWKFDRTQQLEGKQNPVCSDGRIHGDSVPGFDDSSGITLWWNIRGLKPSYYPDSHACGILGFHGDIYVSRSNQHQCADFA